MTLSTGQQLLVAGSPEEVEASILAASRGSIMQLAWLHESPAGRSVGVNPAFVVMVTDGSNDSAET